MGQTIQYTSENDYRHYLGLRQEPEQRLSQPELLYLKFLRRPLETHIHRDASIMGD
jgi:hypothetical protein